MKKTYCDKCKTDWNVDFTVKIDGFEREDWQGFIYRKDVGYISEFHFCGKCINEMSNLIKKWLLKKKIKND